MEPLIHLDTHVLVWLYAGHTDRFGPQTLQRLERAQLVISPMAGLELQYLYEIGRIAKPSDTVVENLRAVLDLRISDIPFHLVTATAATLSWTGDPFDRLITAQAAQQNSELITADTTIQANYERAVWD